MRFHEVLWDFMRFHGIPWSSMRFFDVSVNQSELTEANRGLTSYRKAVSWASSVVPSASFPSNYGSVRRLTRHFKMALANGLLS
jgi:hypothetical protein